MAKPRLLSGDRTTGKLHLGHLAGSLQNRVQLQDEYDTWLLLADVQALTTHYDRPQGLAESVRQIAIDYLAAGIDPEKTTLFVQSQIPEIAELTILFSMFVTVSSLRHNPTIKAEAKERGYKDLYYGFLGYPVSQAADIAFCKAQLVPVGEDNVPHVEQARKIVRRFNALYGPVLVEPQVKVGDTPRLSGLDGAGKMSKSRGNAICLDATTAEIHTSLGQARTDPLRLTRFDPGHPDTCTVFSYHEAFRAEEANAIREECQTGRLGCQSCKGLIADGIDHILAPMRDRRREALKHPDRIDEILQAGTSHARAVAAHTMEEVRDVMHMNYFSARPSKEAST